jgi:hypothetical protein
MSKGFAKGKLTAACHFPRRSATAMPHLLQQARNIAASADELQAKACSSESGLPASFDVTSVESPSPSQHCLTVQAQCFRFRGGRLSELCQNAERSVASRRLPIKRCRCRKDALANQDSRLHAKDGEGGVRKERQGVRATRSRMAKSRRGADRGRRAMGVASCDLHLRPCLGRRRLRTSAGGRVGGELRPKWGVDRRAGTAGA